MADEYRLPAALVEKMAEAIKGKVWQRVLIDGEYSMVQSTAAEIAEAAAAALLDACDVRRYHRLTGQDTPEGSWDGRWTTEVGSDPDKARRRAAHEPGAVLQYYLVIDTPAESVDPPVEPFPRLEGPPGEEPG